VARFLWSTVYIADVAFYKREPK